MKKYLPILFLLATSSVFSQERIPVTLNSTQFYVNILAPSLSFELRVADNQSLVLKGGLTILSEEDAFRDDHGSINPFTSLTFRNYYPRKRVKKALRPNSGNFIGLTSGYIFGGITDNSSIPEFEDENEFYLGPVWGIQRNYNSGIHLGLHIGGGFITENGGVDGHFIFDFEFGFTIGGKPRYAAPN